MSKNKLFWLVGGVVVAMAAVVAIGIVLQSGSEAQACRQKGVTRTVVIQDDKMTPQTTTAQLCDVLTIKNTDPITREIAFGEHDRHVAYDGITERSLAQNESVTITLNKTGTYHFHDHFHDEVEGYFTVR